MLKQYLNEVLLTLPLVSGIMQIEEVEVTDQLQAPSVALEGVKEEVIQVEATFYTAYCKGCIGITKSGHDVRETIYADGYRVIAVDPAIISLGSIVEVNLEDGQVFEAIASDTGGLIKGNIIDVLVKSEKEAFQLGRQQAKIRIVENK